MSTDLVNHMSNGDVLADSASMNISTSNYSPKQLNAPTDSDWVTDLEKGEFRSDGDLERNAAADVTASRIISRHLTGAEEFTAQASDTDEPLPQMGGNRDYPPLAGDISIYTVAFNGPDDPLHPYNWSLKKKLSASFAVGFLALCASLGSAMFSEAGTEVEKIYKVGETVATLGTSLFVFGFASGPIVWGPSSELFGRKKVLIISGFMYACFCFAVAVSKDIQSIMICRFFSGFMSGAPFVAAPAAMADIFDRRTMCIPVTFFAMVLFGGPMLAPIFGGFIVKNSLLGWRWTSYITGILTSASVGFNIFFYKESHHPIILIKKAEILRRRTKNWAIHAAHEEVSLDIKEIVQKNITKPIIMLFTEPIIFLISLYNAFIYGILYLCLTAIPLIFKGQYGFRDGIAQLPYLSMLIGIFFGGALIIWMDKKYVRATDANGGKPIPEERLPPMMVGGFFFAAGLFWLCWAGEYADKVHWIVPTLGIACIGFGLITIFLPCICYIIDCYLSSAASALASNTLLRSSFGAAFPLFAMQMFVNLKIKWAGTLLGCIAIILIPVPFLFYKYGPQLRYKSKYAFVL